MKTKMKTGGMVNKKKKYGEGGPTTKPISTPREQSSQPNTPPTGPNKLTGNPRFKTGGAKPKAMYGTSMKPGMMKKGCSKKAC
jgi:hypothetical protein